MSNSLIITGNKIFDESSSVSKIREVTAAERAEGIIHAEEVTLTMKEVK